MQNILMVDLYGQYLKLKTEIDEAIQEVIRSSVFIKTGKVVDFERQLSQFMGAEVITCGNGTDALQIAFMALGLQPGDEVITTPFTFVSTVEVLVLLGLKPVFADVDSATFNINTDGIERLITSKTKAILPVHLFGQCACMESIMGIAGRYGLYVIEDSAQAIGTTYFFKNGTAKNAGTIGNIGTTSFFPSKGLGAFGDGGAIFCNDKGLAVKMRSVANHGMTEKYQYENVGLNSRLDNIQAAILEVKLKYLGEHINARQKAAAFYDENLKNIDRLFLPGKAGYSNHTYHQYTVRTKLRNELKIFLEENGIPSAVYYPKPLHLQKAYRFLGYTEGDFPIGEKLSETVLSLPMHTELTEKQLIFITNKVKEFFKKY
ncbi:Aminotransferase, DegT/DnrJ/EryC1/StrS family [hydrothermal vent metagenome]|uniref:Aminotransferase, DegT/DnrJ/EryC1/StrS family n=1 Tax=hydrothermal vent metagenome TaxID=652676 RepID=A0A3B0THC5_9ZZZZ